MSLVCKKAQAKTLLMKSKTGENPCSLAVKCTGVFTFDALAAEWMTHAVAQQVLTRPGGTCSELFVLLCCVHLIKKLAGLIYKRNRNDVVSGYNAIHLCEYGIVQFVCDIQHVLRFLQLKYIPHTRLLIRYESTRFLSLYIRILTLFL